LAACFAIAAPQTQANSAAGSTRKTCRLSANPINTVFVMRTPFSRSITIGLVAATCAFLKMHRRLHAVWNWGRSDREARSIRLSLARGLLRLRSRWCRQLPSIAVNDCNEFILRFPNPQDVVRWADELRTLRAAFLGCGLCSSPDSSTPEATTSPHLFQ